MPAFKNTTAASYVYVFIQDYLSNITVLLAGAAKPVLSDPDLIGGF